MLAYTYIQQGKFELLDKPKPVLLDDRDAIVKVTLASICTSDLHIKHGSVPRAVPGITVGHHCKAWGPGDGECGDLLRKLFFLSARMGQQLYRPKRRLGVGVPH